MAMLEEHAREIDLGMGLKITTFCDPPAPEPVRRWRVVLPQWFPGGSWLDGAVGAHSFVSLEAALSALEETGTLTLIDEYWKAQRALSNLRHKTFGAIMSAHGRRDTSYDDLLRERHAEQRRREIEGRIAP